MNNRHIDNLHSSSEFMKPLTIADGIVTKTTYFLGFLLEFLNGSLVNTTTFVNQVPSGCRLARVDVSNDDDVDVHLFLTHDLC